MAPVSSEGWAVVAFFVGCMVAGAVGLFLFSFAYREPFIGVVSLVIFAIVGAGTFIWLANVRGDKQHTVDYRVTMTGNGYRIVVGVRPSWQLDKDDLRHTIERINSGSLAGFGDVSAGAVAGSGSGTSRGGTKRTKNRILAAMGLPSRVAG